MLFGTNCSDGDQHMQQVIMYWLDNCYFVRYHPDKNANDPKAADMFKEVTFSYNILSDPEKKRQYDAAGFEVSGCQGM